MYQNIDLFLLGDRLKHMIQSILNHNAGIASPNWRLAETMSVNPRLTKPVIAHLSRSVGVAGIRGLLEMPDCSLRDSCLFWRDQIYKSKTKNEK